METRVPADQSPTTPAVSVPDPGFRSSPAAPPGEDPLEHRLARLEARMDDLDSVIHDAVPAAWQQAVESACRAAVAVELQGVSEDLRRAVSELGRLLLRDLDRLTKVLADHRDAIVERLSAPTADEPPAPSDDTPSPPPPPPVLEGEEGRWRVLPGWRPGGRASRRGAGHDRRRG